MVIITCIFFCSIYEYVCIFRPFYPSQLNNGLTTHMLRIFISETAKVPLPYTRLTFVIVNKVEPSRFFTRFDTYCSRGFSLWKTTSISCFSRPPSALNYMRSSGLSRWKLERSYLERKKYTRSFLKDKVSCLTLRAINIWKIHPETWNTSVFILKEFVDFFTLFALMVF